MMNNEATRRGQLKGDERFTGERVTMEIVGIEGAEEVVLAESRHSGLQ
jgi:hypothetical protein